MLVPDSKLISPAEIEERIQSIYRQRNAECEKGPRRTRSGESRPEWQNAHMEKLNKFDLRADALNKRIKALRAEAQ